MVDVPCRSPPCVRVVLPLPLPSRLTLSILLGLLARRDSLFHLCVNVTKAQQPPEAHIPLGLVQRSLDQVSPRCILQGLIRGRVSHRLKCSQAGFDLDWRCSSISPFSPSNCSSSMIPEVIKQHNNTSNIYTFKIHNRRDENKMMMNS